MKDTQQPVAEATPFIPERVTTGHTSQLRSFVSKHHYVTGQGHDVIPIAVEGAWPPNFIALVLKDNRNEPEDAERYAALITETVNAEVARHHSPSEGATVEKRDGVWLMGGKQLQSCAREIAEAAMTGMQLDPSDFIIRDKIITAISGKLAGMLDSVKKS